MIIFHCEEHRGCSRFNVMDFPSKSPDSGLDVRSKSQLLFTVQITKLNRNNAIYFTFCMRDFLDFS